ncbi:phage tail assembly protein [Helicobacter sp. faydin-H20]|uniref:phage tail assembly protein n=1 Tax=Helicobacter anatolicus TaxID=2905874 RepID=UPI001E4D25D2|nr:phage tail assembly protein [Helicobacter anatolicus]MCE3037524.1 phage tail assembly protein [Helicobacter anatolicus]
MLKNFEKESMIFKFRDGQEVLLKEPTLLQLQASNHKKDEISQVKHLLLDMSDGELTEEFLNHLPLSEWKRLAEVVAGFAGVDTKNLERA